MRPNLQLAIVSLLCLSACAQQANCQGLSVSAYEKNGQIQVFLKNGSKTPELIAKDFSFAGRSGGNVLAIVVNDLGQLAPPCAILDSLTPPSESRTLTASATIEIWSGSTTRLAQWHCLGPGSYKVFFAYRKADGTLIVSNSITLVASKSARNRIKGDGGN
jgi:hypothetical protein